jgi:hypothetical protein
MPFPPHKSCRGTVWLLIPQTREKLGTTRGDSYRKAKRCMRRTRRNREHKTPKKCLQTRYIGKEERYTQLHHHHRLSIA